MLILDFIIIMNLRMLKEFLSNVTRGGIIVQEYALDITAPDAVENF